MRLLSNALCILAIATTCVAAKADTLNFTLTGQANFLLTFSLPSNPTPSVAQPGDGFTLSGVPVSQGGVTIISDLTFSNASNNGGLIIIPGLSLTGPQLYAGSETSPLFAPGSFALTDIGNNTPVSLAIATASSVPEPGNLALISAGALALVGFARRRLVAPMLRDPSGH